MSMKSDETHVKNTENNILYTEHHGVVTLTLNRPEKRNAFDDATIATLTQYLHTIQQNDKIRVLVLQGAGDHFCAGADITWMQKAAGYSFEANQRDAIKLAELMQLLYHLKKPSITVVQGSIYGGGIGLVACSDIVLAYPSARFCFSEVKLGLVPAVVGSYVVQAIGLRAAKRYMLTAEVFDANIASHLGLIHEVVTSETVSKRLEFFIHQLQSNGPMAIRETKDMLDHFTEHPRSPGNYTEYTSELIARLRASDEAREGFTAFLEKRSATWMK